MVPGNRLGCLLLAGVDMAITTEDAPQPVSLGCRGEGAVEHVALKRLWSILCCVCGMFYLVKTLKNILCLIGIYLFLSCVGQDTSSWFYLELN